MIETKYQTNELTRLMKKRPFRFPVYYRAGKENDIEVLELSVRSYNCLRRVGILTVEQLIDYIDGTGDLLKIRNLGKNSATEIMEKLFWYNYERLSDGRREGYLAEIFRINHDT